VLRRGHGVPAGIRLLHGVLGLGEGAEEPVGDVDELAPLAHDRPQPGVAGHQASGATNWRSSSTAIFFPRAKRSMPSGTLKSTPKSSRLTVVAAEKPACVLPSAASTWTPWNSTSRDTGRVTPFSVSSPSSSYSPSPSARMAVERNVISGWSAAEKKSVLSRWAS